jgi:transposase-like protein
MPIAAHFAEVYGATVSRDTISRITDKVVGEMTEWRNRPVVPNWSSTLCDRGVFVYRPVEQIAAS